MSDAQLRQLPAEECRALLAASEVGRVGVSVRPALPAIFPVRFAMVDDHVVFRTPSDSLLARVVADAIVAFEADAIDDNRGGGWSVLVVGRAEMIDTGPELDHVRRVVVLPRTTDADDSFVRIATDTISGRAFATAS